MKNALIKISILLNLGLLGGLICLLTIGQKNPSESSSPVAVATKPLNNEAEITVATPAPADPKPFCWSQLDSTDYHVYVKNLRNIGCPEPTIRAIVAADVHAAYQSRGETLARQLANLAGSSWSNKLATGSAEIALRAELGKLPNQEAAKVADLIELPPAPQSTAADANATVNNVPEQSVSLPLVLQNVDLAALNLNDNQIQVINDLRQSFMNDVGGPGQNPEDPAYLKRWQQAQPQTDAQLRDFLGTTVYQNYQVEVGSSTSSSADGNLRQIWDIKR